MKRMLVALLLLTACSTAFAGDAPDFMKEGGKVYLQKAIFYPPAFDVIVGFELRRRPTTGAGRGTPLAHKRYG